MPTLSEVLATHWLNLTAPGYLSPATGSVPPICGSCVAGLQRYSGALGWPPSARVKAAWGTNVIDLSFIFHACFYTIPFGFALFTTPGSLLAAQVHITYILSRSSHLRLSHDTFSAIAKPLAKCRR